MWDNFCPIKYEQERCGSQGPGPSEKKEAKEKKRKPVEAEAGSECLLVVASGRSNQAPPTRGDAYMLPCGRDCVGLVKFCVVLESRFFAYLW